MSDFASSANGVLRYIEEVTPGTTPGSGNGTNLRFTTPTMKAAVATVKSNEVRPDRLKTGSVRSDLNLDGGFNFELSGKEYDPFFESLLCDTWSHYGVSGLGVSFTATTLAGSITAGSATSGSSDFSNIGLGEWIKVIPPSGASQAVKDYFADRWFKTHASTAATSTVITLDASTPIEAPGIVTGVAGYKVSQSIISNGTTKKYHTLEYGLTDISEYMAFRGMRANTMDLNIDVGAIITGSFGFVGLGHSSVTASTLPGSPIDSQTLDPLSAVTDVGTIYEAGTDLLANGSFIKSVKLNVNNNLRGQKAVAVYGNAGIGDGELALSGQLEVYMADAAYYRKWINGTNTKFTLGMADADGNGYLYDFGKVTFRDVGFNPGGTADDVMLTLPFDAYYDPATGKGIRVFRAIAA
jgi:hypothetical protein